MKIYPRISDNNHLQSCLDIWRSDFELCFLQIFKSVIESGKNEAGGLIPVSVRINRQHLNLERDSLPFELYPASNVSSLGLEGTGQMSLWHSLEK